MYFNYLQSKYNMKAMGTHYTTTTTTTTTTIECLALSSSINYEENIP
jgi:hypothetical protein